jgi:hypothetical protein
VKKFPNPFLGVSVAGKAVSVYHCPELYQMTEVSKNLYFFILNNAKGGTVDLAYDIVEKEVKSSIGAKYSYDPHYVSIRQLIKFGFIAKRAMNIYWTNPVFFKISK